MEAFSEAWADAWCQRLNSDPRIARGAQGWEGSVALVMTGPRHDRAVWLDLSSAGCREARPANDQDLKTARFLLSGSAQAWKGVLSGHIAPLQALLTGQLRLDRGSVAALIPYAGLARDLLDLAASMPAEWPE